MKKNILIISGGLIHPSLLSQIALKILLLGIGKNYCYTVSKSVRGLQKLNQGIYDAVILYFHEKKIDETSLDALIRFAENGGGVLALHSAMASFKTVESYRDFLGGRFSVHGKIEKIDIFKTSSGHFVVNNVNSFTIRDELYIHDYDSSNEIVMSCNNKGTEEPVLWTKKHGNGRICYFAPGHCPNVWFNREVRKVIKNALQWVCKTEDLL